MTKDTQQLFLPGRPTSGNWISIGNPSVAEICSHGFDFVLIDMEHTPTSLETIENMLRAVHTDTAPIVRVPSNDPVLIKRVLDLGVAGLMIPAIETADQAQQAVDAMQYPPDGTRGVGIGRAADYGRTIGEYFETADDDLETVVQIETERGVENADAIVSTAGVDAVLIGPADLSASMGVFGQWDDDRFESAVNSIITSAQDNDTAVGMIAIDREGIHRWTATGIDFLIVGVDISYLSAGSDAARAEFEEFADEKSS